MAFYYNQGNIADRKDSLLEKTNNAALLNNCSHAANTDNRIRNRQRRQPGDKDATDQALGHMNMNNAQTTTNNSGRRRERLGETLRMARQGVSRREATRLAKIFGESSATDSPDHASSAAATGTKHSGGRRRGGGGGGSDRQVSVAEVIESNLEPKELLLNSAGRVSYGTWRGLIMCLTSIHQKTDDFVSIFMLSFRSFATPTDLAEALVTRARNVAHADARLSSLDLKLWHDRVQAPIQYNVFHIIRLWYSDFWYPTVDNVSLNYLCAFLLNEYLPSRHGSSAKECQKLLRQISSKNCAIDLRSLAASPATSLMPLGLSRPRALKSPVMEHLEILSPTNVASRQKSTLSKHHKHDTPTKKATKQHSASYRDNIPKRNAGLPTDAVRTLNSEDASLNNANNDSSHSNSLDRSNQRSTPKRKNLLRRLFSKQRRNRSNTHNSSHSRAETNATNTDDESVAPEFAATREGSVASGVYIEESARRLPPPSVRTGGGLSTTDKLSPARERMLAEINTQTEADGEGGRHPITRSPRSDASSSSSEGPDISDLLMATVGMDLSYEAYRQISHITHVNPLDVACQLTIIESSCYCMIQPAELLNKEFSLGCNSHAVNVRQMSRWCTQITRWVSVLILSEATPERRCRMLKYAIQLGTHLLALKNYDGVMAIKAAIFSAAVMRLKRSWSLLPKKFDLMSKRLHEAMDSERNFANYRAVLHRSQPPLLPFLGLYLTDLTFLEDGNPTYRRFVLPHENPQLQKHLSHQTAHGSDKHGDDYHMDDKQDADKSHCPSSDIGTSDPASRQAYHQQDDTETQASTSQQQQQQQQQMSSSVKLTGQTCALFAKRNEVDLQSRSILINFEKSYRVASILQEIRKFQVEYSGNFTMAIPGLQQYLIEQWDRCEAEGYDDEKIYNMSLQREPRAACPLNTGYVSEGAGSRVLHHQPVQSAMRLTRLLPGAAQRLRGREISDAAFPSFFE
ncbi:Ras guanine nucleotide exchange factor bud5 [Coemansia sp. RSA 1813]|nr:Ras guanine nucleotide exchange factor bud5 [Coemansia sp. RSA 1646]KAJ1772729.1 Ras guanine nucleotide exchange factor bud5 [Coemansia sp. RSA 1843]KAJ2090681.1 Ras guanine nucleotide exchange factor bud5 [Coemansia sp. RSA 986]KAJ2216115.1 Ras guanine nucleotide exchange factor bud5 [Coemansia sp. RSA 487]KAJ2570100.1 Ras guanine nucleotide exchange factor bud5 [Coemansia sp. RSA 1813]